MATSTALVMIGGAGIMNGSFALPTKYLKWKLENIWLQYVIWAFVILPWAIAALFSPQVFQVYLNMPSPVLLAMVLGGVFFGIGQMCFAIGLNNIGLGLGFVINIGLSTALGSLLPMIIQHTAANVSQVTLIAIAIIVMGLVLYFFAGKYRDQQQGKAINKQGNFRLGLALVVIAGLSSAAQNLSFSMSSQMQQLALQAGMNTFAAANIFWPGFLTFGFIPYALYMVSLHTKNQSWQQYATPGLFKNYALIILMASFWYGSLLLYSKASQIMGSIGPMIGWPVFMVLIILTSNFWGVRHKEWANCSGKTKLFLALGLSLLVIAVMLLGYSASLTK